jgi:uroporphyrinogen-III synthase
MKYRQRGERIMPAMTTQANPPTPWQLISLRPSGEHAALRAAVRRHGGQLVAVSPWRIQYETGLPARQALGVTLAAPVVIFTSPAAVRAAGQLSVLQRPPQACWMSVGAGTAAALHRQGIDQVVVPTRMDSEGLLALPVLTQHLPCDVGLVTAPDGRATLTATLRARGARIVRADVYRRVPITLRAAVLARLRTISDRSVLAVSSGVALRLTLAQLPAELAQRWRQGPVVVASERLLQLAQALEFTHVQRAAGPLPAQLAAAAAAIMTPSIHD